MKEGTEGFRKLLRNSAKGQKSGSPLSDKLSRAKLIHFNFYKIGQFC